MDKEMLIVAALPCGCVCAFEAVSEPAFERLKEFWTKYNIKIMIVGKEVALKSYFCYYSTGCSHEMTKFSPGAVLAGDGVS